jgi:hypothetical protein
MRKALIFSAVISAAVVPLPLAIGLFGRKVSNRRLEAQLGIYDSDNSNGNSSTSADAEVTATSVVANKNDGNGN